MINVSIDENNITFTASYDPLVADSSYTTGQIKYKVQQGAESSLGIIDIVFKTRCSAVICTEDNQVCDPCLGTCVDEVVDISVSSQESNPLIDIQIS